MLTHLLETGTTAPRESGETNKESLIGQQPEAKSLFQVREDDKNCTVAEYFRLYVFFSASFSERRSWQKLRHVVIYGIQAGRLVPV